MPPRDADSAVCAKLTVTVSPVADVKVFVTGFVPLLAPPVVSWLHFTKPTSVTESRFLVSRLKSTFTSPPRAAPMKMKTAAMARNDARIMAKR